MADTVDTRLTLRPTRKVKYEQGASANLTKPSNTRLSILANKCEHWNAPGSFSILPTMEMQSISKSNGKEG
jgi:hypothetical protein